MNNKYIPPEKDIDSLLSEEGETRLSALMSKSRELKVLDRILNETLDSPLRDHVIVANFREGTLVIEANSGEWSTHLRYLAPTLLEPLRKHKEFASLCRVQFYVSPKTSEKVSDQEETKKVLPTLETESIKLIKSTADGIDDPELSAALKRLATKEIKD